MLRYQYNYLLAERFNWWEQNRTAVNSCPLITHLPELKEQPNYYSQKRSLVQLKRARPRYKEIHSTVLQDMVKRVDLAFSRYLKGDSKGKRSGKPRFKAKSRYRTFTYQQGKDIKLVKKRVYLPKIGEVKVIWHRPLPDVFTIKTVVISKKVDGFYIAFSLEDKSVPIVTSDVNPTMDNSIGIDLGLKKLVTTSNGLFIDPPKYFRQAEYKLAKLQSKVSERKKGSRARRKLFKKVAKLHLKIARQRKDFHYNTAQKLLTMADCVFVEDLQIANMAKKNKAKQDEQGNYLPNGQSQKSGLNKSFADAALARFVEILLSKAEKAGLMVVKVNPWGTSQYCSTCLNKVSKTLSDRWHSCPNCMLSIDRDLNSAILIKKVGLGIASLKNGQSSIKVKDKKPTP